MSRITAVELRDNLKEVLARVRAGEEIVVTYRGGSAVRLIPEREGEQEMAGLDALLAHGPTGGAMTDDPGTFDDKYNRHLESRYGKYTG